MTPGVDASPRGRELLADLHDRSAEFATLPRNLHRQPEITEIIGSAHRPIHAGGIDARGRRRVAPHSIPKGRI